MQMAPKFEQLAQKNTDVGFYKVDVDVASDVATAAEVTAMPTFKFYRKGNVVGSIVGANPTALREKIDQLR